MEPNGSLTRKEVSPEIEEKVLRFATSRETFTVKDVFEAYPNNQEYLLRYAILNLRIDGKIFMFGNKRGAYYSINPVEQATIIEEEKKDGLTWHELVLREARKFQGKWFKRTDLELKDYSVPQIITTLKELIDLGKIDKRGELRWTEYYLTEDVKKPVIEEPRVRQYKEQILNYIKKMKIVTIPMIVEALEIPRIQVVPIIEAFEQMEEIRHEGSGRGSKYIHKDVKEGDIEKLTEQVNAERAISQQVDELSDFLFSDEVVTIGIGHKDDKIIRMNFFSNGETIKTFEFPDLGELIHKLHNMTVLRG